MAASRLLRAVAAFVILLSFAAGQKERGCKGGLWVGSVKFGLWSVECEVRSEKCEVWSVKEAVRNVDCEVWSVKCGLWSVDCEVWSVKCEVRSVKFGAWRKHWEVWTVKCEVWTVKCEVCSVKCEVWGLECEGSSEKWEVWSVKCGVWSLKFGVRRVQCAVWGVECRGKDTVGTGCLWTIGHLCLGNFRRRLARVYVICNVPFILVASKRIVQVSACCVLTESCVLLSAAIRVFVGGFQVLQSSITALRILTGIVHMITRNWWTCLWFLGTSLPFSPFWFSLIFSKFLVFRNLPCPMPWYHQSKCTKCLGSQPETDSRSTKTGEFLLMNMLMIRRTKWWGT